MVILMPYYNLDEVRSAAKAERIRYRGRRVFLDAANLGYQLADVISCLCGLTLEEFQKTHFREDGSIDDAYVTRHPRPDGDGALDELYVKFSLVDDFLMISLGSFHLSRF
ncbi:MqsR (Motility quorum-sensing regulator) toxin of toxin-antitoxin system [Marinobacter persicus]|uniref:MqsR (Motility quorum-sensing regulator) toxin of toxin-antitoxin system n=2 Tax=Marinobacter persicus TaxID=930118 RepID=A0A2S6G646_9GAMM|nr:MqsR (Motility quorum-sensing regulator) toxin of toxin-antitoxin system [Marinobacter persicus]PPK54605.1 MqsR (Motility quorum-sensing regulator) toxin of toxin-antitoxin system [Marinobacter persicus]PPK58031.1 MqsR (Motility quorum-sensing regulator) toxin of toxin-antitoxin system [Marinobacter persicus]